jgi:hypothetical protein
MIFVKFFNNLSLKFHERKPPPSPNILDDGMKIINTVVY